MQVLRSTDRGLECAAGDFAIDPWGEIDVACVSHAHADHARPVSKIVHCSEPGVLLTQRRVGSAEVIGHPYGEPFRLGDATVSFHPAGHILGSAQIRVEVAGEVWVFSGDYKRESDPTCKPFEVVPCDTFITEATFALPIYRWKPTEEVVDEIWAWWQQNVDRNKTSMLFCYSLGKAQRILAGLANKTERPVYVHGSVLPWERVYRDAGVKMVPTEYVTDAEHPTDFAGELVIAPPSASRSTWMKRFRDPDTAFASGWMRIRGMRRGRGWDRGFVLSDHVDWPGLVETVHQTGASRVYATHGKTDVIVRYLREHGIDAASLETTYGGEEED